MKKISYTDHFDEASNNYRSYRPTYPDALYEFILSHVKGTDLAWDVGTGNGQAAVKLAEYFQKVYATDVSENQLKAAIKKENVEYIQCEAEKTPLPEHGVDLVTIAQALHWFHFDQFYREVKRMAKKSGLIAAWCYSLCKFNQPEMDAVVAELYDQILGDQFWPPARRYIDNAYETIPFPFKKIPTPLFTMSKIFNFNDFIGYLTTWSAVKEYIKRKHAHPIELILPKLKSLWGDVDKTYEVHWPIYLLLGEVN